MHFDIINIVWINTSIVHDLLEQNLLSLRMWVSNGHGIGRMICRSLQYHTKNAIVVCLSIFKTLNDNGADPITAAIAIVPDILV